MLLNTFCMLDVACCTPRATVLEAAYLMRRRDMLKRLAKEVNVVTEIVSREQSREERARR